MCFQKCLSLTPLQMRPQMRQSMTYPLDSYYSLTIQSPPTLLSFYTFCRDPDCTRIFLYYFHLNHVIWNNPDSFVTLLYGLKIFTATMLPLWLNTWYSTLDTIWYSMLYMIDWTRCIIPFAPFLIHHFTPKLYYIFWNYIACYLSAKFCDFMLSWHSPICHLIKHYKLQHVFALTLLTL